METEENWVVHIDRDYIAMTLDASYTMCGIEIDWRHREGGLVHSDKAGEATCPKCIEVYREVSGINRPIWDIINEQARKDEIAMLDADMWKAVQDVTGGGEK